jgi:2,4-dienoyl-CoA reductase-like NADH-dependent reductase (Old Yellow Enzyme family)
MSVTIASARRPDAGGHITQEIRMPGLLDPITLGDLQLQNCVIMAPLTRNRSSGVGRVPNALMAQYYAQRASAGAILSEATSVMPSGVGYPQTPGIWSREHVEGWRGVTNAVHEAGGKILLQLWHVGRISDPSYHDGAPPVAPSAVAASGNVSLLRPQRPYPLPRALRTDEIPSIVAGFRQGALNARTAGFDGVEIHGANGYLLDQFLQDRTNQRTDQYGGSIENRARLLLEVTDAVVSVWGAGLVGVHLAPRGEAHDIADSNPAETFGYAVSELSRRGIAFLCVRESLTGHRFGPALRAAFRGSYIANEGLTPESAQGLLAAGEADAVAFGKLFIANPDLPQRLRANLPLNAWQSETFYSSGPEGYTDYPAAQTAAE